MVDPHERVIILKNSFDEAWEALRRKGEIALYTDKKGTPFTAKAETAQRGAHRGNRVIRFSQNNVEKARSYTCCWGHYFNCNRTRIGMYCKTLDDFLRRR